MLLRRTVRLLGDVLVTTVTAAASILGATWMDPPPGSDNETPR